MRRAPGDAAVAAAACLLLSARADGQGPPPLPRVEWGATAVTVTQERGRWVLSGAKTRVTVNEADLALEVQAGPARWSLVASGPRDLLVRSRGEDFFLRLADAGRIAIEPYDPAFKTGFKLTATGFRRPGSGPGSGELDLALYLTVCLEGEDEELVFDLAAREGEAVVRQLDWPAALDARDVDHTVLSHYRGTLLPRDWPKAYDPIRPEGTYAQRDTSEIQSHVVECWSMSWWGFQKGPSALMMIVETPDDAAYRFSHPAGGPTVIGPRWRASLGRLRYPRSARLVFFSAGNYVQMAKRYRRHAMEGGLFVSLREKIAGTPEVKRLVGTPLHRLSILRNLSPESSRYDVGAPEKNYRLLFRHGIKPQGVYLDVFGYVPPDEDFNPEHPTTRSESIRDRAACFRWTRANLGLVGTEPAVDWTVPYVDISSPLRPARAGIPVPLFNLVYHDAILTPYRPGDLHGFLNGGLPQLGNLEEDLGKDLPALGRMAALNERVALLEMTNHEFLDERRRRERSTFADGTTVTVDRDAGTVSIFPEVP